MGTRITTTGESQGGEMPNIDNFMIEITLKKRKFTDVPEKFEDIVTEYKQYESDDRIVIDVPRNWSGLKDGTMVQMLKHFGEAIYVALAYVSGSDEIVVDLDGRVVDNYPIIIGGVQKKKYVKKRLRIIKIYDRDNEVFSVEDYILDLAFFDCIVNVLKVYCVGRESTTLKLKNFIEEVK